MVSFSHSTSSIRELRRYVWEVVHPPPILLQHKSLDASTRPTFHITGIIRTTTAIDSSILIGLDWSGIALLEVGACLQTSVGIDMIEREPLQLQILIEVYVHGYVDDTPMDLFEAWRLGGGADVSPEVD